MGILYISDEGVKLRDIIAQLGNKDYPIIMYRCLWTLDGVEEDDLMGYCKYESGVLESLDGDNYSLEDKFIKWQEWVNTDEEFADNGQVCLTVYEKGYTLDGVTTNECEVKDD